METDVARELEKEILGPGYKALPCGCVRFYDNGNSSFPVTCERHSTFDALVEDDSLWPTEGGTDSDEDVARALEQQILGDHVAFPCGCVLMFETHYPGRPWVRTNTAVSTCEQHPSPQHVHEELFRSNPRHPVFGGSWSPLEMVWLTPNGDQVTLEELERAMQEWRMQMAARVASLGEAIHINELHDPWILSQERHHIIDRRGYLRTVAASFAKQYKPGDLINPTDVARAEAW